MSVYFVRSGDYIKVGFSDSLQARLSSMQTDNAEELEVLLIMPGDIELERWFHEYFSRYHYRGEWFLYSSEIENFLVKHAEIFDSYKSSKLTSLSPKTIKDDEEILQWISNYVLRHSGNWPSYRMIVDNTNLTSTSQVAPYVERCKEMYFS